MGKSIRKLVTSLLLFGIFAAISIYVIILAQGNKFDIDSGGITTTSIIRINSIPTDVDVFINDLQVAKNENRVEGLEPGTVKISLRKSGYKNWERTISLREGVVEDVFAQLYPERLAFERITNTDVDNYYLSDNSEFVFYTVLNSDVVDNNGLWRIRLNRNILDFGEITPQKIATLSPELLLSLQANPYEISISPDNSRVLLRVNADSILELVDVGSGVFTDLTENLTFYPLENYWFDGSTSLILSSNKIVAQYEISNAQTTLIYFSEEIEPVYFVYSNILYLYRSDKKAVQQYQNKQIRELVLPISIEREVISKIFGHKSNSDVLYLETDKDTIFIDLEKEFSERFIVIGELIDISANGKVTLYNAEGVLKSIFFKESVDKESYTIQNSDFTIQYSKIFDTEFSTSGRNLSLIVENNSQVEIWFADFDGNNAQRVIEDEFLAINKIAIANNSIDLYLLLEDSSTTGEEVKVNNVYRFKLESE